MHKWDNVLVGVSINDIYNRELSLAEADKYIFDFNGLLQSIDIPEKYWYPHIKLNNFKSFTEYDGRTTIYLLDSSFLDKMYSVINNNSVM
jgi:hypothetical protein